MSNKSKSGPQISKQPDAQSHEHAPEQEPISTHRVVVGLVVLLIAAVVLAALGMLARMHSNTALAQRTDAGGCAHCHHCTCPTRRAGE